MDIKPDSRLTFKALNVFLRSRQLLIAFVTDLRTAPLYPISEAARIVQAPRSTLSGWLPRYSDL